MLNLAFFGKPSFSAAVGSNGLALFGLVGSLFVLTQFLQFSLGYSAWQAGVRMLPLPGGGGQGREPVVTGIRDLGPLPASPFSPTSPRIVRRTVALTAEGLPSAQGRKGLCDGYATCWRAAALPPHTRRANLESR
jgi:hypothetical protein